MAVQFLDVGDVRSHLFADELGALAGVELADAIGLSLQKFGDLGIDRRGSGQLYREVFRRFSAMTSYTLMIEPCGRTGFTDETLEQARPVRLAQAAGERGLLYRDVTVEVLVASAPDDPHAAAAERFQQPVTSRENSPRESA